MTSMHFGMKELHRESYIKAKSLTKEFLHFTEFQAYKKLELEIVLF